MNPHFASFFAWLLRASWQAAVLAILVLAAQLIFRKKLSARWRYALWLLVVARLALPVSPPSPMSIFNYARLDRLAGKTLARLVEPPLPLPAPNTVLTGKPAAPRSPGLSQSPPPNPDPAQSPLPATAPTPTAAPGAPPPPAPQLLSIYAKRNWPALGGAIWLGGVLFLAARVMRQNAVFLRQLREAREVSDAETAGLLEECRRLLGVSASVRLAEIEHIKSPALYRPFHPKNAVAGGPEPRIDPRRIAPCFPPRTGAPQTPRHAGALCHRVLEYVELVQSGPLVCLPPDGGGPRTGLR